MLLIIYLATAVYAAVVVFSCCGYIKSSYDKSRQRTNFTEIFAIKDTGVSLDKREIYSLNLDELGLGDG